MISLTSNRFRNCFYEKMGQGEPLVLIHGFAEDHRVWSSIIHEMQHHFLLIVPDLPGSGSSSLPEEDMTMELLADFIQEILEEERVDQVHLFGHSMGGYVMMAFLERYREKVKSIGFIHSTSMADDEAKKEMRSKAIRMIQDYPTGKTTFLSTMVPNLFSSQFKENHPDKVLQHLTQALEFTSDALAAYYNAMKNRKNRMEIIRDLPIPVLFVIGSEDNAIPKEQNFRECYLPRKAFIDLMDPIGHMSMYENGEGLNKTVKSFLEFISHD